MWINDIFRRKQQTEQNDRVLNLNSIPLPPVSEEALLVISLITDGATLIKDQHFDLNRTTIQEILENVRPGSKVLFENCNLSLMGREVILSADETKMFNITFRKCRFSFFSGMHANRTCLFSQCVFFSNHSPVTLSRTFDPNEQLRDIEYLYAESCVFYDCHLKNFDGVNLASSVIESSTLSGTWRKARLDNSKLHNCTFDEPVFNECEFQNAAATDLLAYPETQFNKCKVAGFSIERIAIDGMRNKGGLVPSQLRTMNVRDDLARLRGSFSGFQTWIHVWFLIIFLLPFILFIFGKVFWSSVIQHGGDLAAKVSLVENVTDVEGSPKNSISYYSEPIAASLKTMPSEPLILQVGKFAWYGGRRKGDGLMAWGHRIVMLVIVLFNCFRLRLLYKTLQLEHQESVTGVPSGFSIKDSPIATVFVNHPKWIWLPYIAVSIVNLILFAWVQVPV